MNANAISKPRYSAAVNAIPQSCASLLPFFFPPARNASPSPSTGLDATEKARSLLHAHRGELRTLNRRPNSPSLHAPLLFRLPFLLRRGFDIPAISPPPSPLPPSPLAARLPHFRTYMRDKRLFIAVHRAARVIKSAARGI